jgi:glycosyltransferase involved in cell wall biosynthesis
MDQQQGTVLFLPAHNEDLNLPSVVKKAVAFLEERGGPGKVIIVDDGSTDETPEVIRNLQLEYPGIVYAVRHEVNRGYGAALRTGLQAGFETGFGWIGFCDSDQQFDPGDFSKLFDHAEETGAPVVIGYRIERADNLKRRMMGRAWHWLSARILGYEATDVDCGFKIFRRDVAEDLLPRLSGEHATISPEILARTHRAGFEITEIGVPHYPRGHGSQTGANLQVILASLLGLYRIRRNIRNEASA